MSEFIGKNGHYSEQNGHALRGEHERVRVRLGGAMPESINGFKGIEQQRIKRSMKRIPKAGKK